MKQKDVALIILIIGISAGMAFAVSNFLFATPQNRQQNVAIVDKITSQFTSPSSQFFNIHSIDPAQLIEVQSSNNSNPFNGSAQ